MNYELRSRLMKLEVIAPQGGQSSFAYFSYKKSEAYAASAKENSIEVAVKTATFFIGGYGDGVEGEDCASRFLVYSEDNPYTAHAAGALALSGATKEAKRSFSYLGFSSLRFIFRPPPTAYYEAKKSVLFKQFLSVTLSVHF